jgi:protein-S-isoprenylcysteine O-methyltransferase Ste14
MKLMISAKAVLWQSMMITYDTIIFVSWAAFLLVWGVSAFFVKRDVRSGGYAALWQRHWVLRLAVAALIIVVAVRLGRAGSPGAALFSHGIFTPAPALGWIGAALTATGIGFAIWARVKLGRNWSSHPAVKEHHQLVTTGPYAYVRHPIYAGIMLAALGTALVSSIFGVGMFIFISIAFALRLRKEEKIMLELFPDHYPAYQKHTKRLVPFVW